MLMVMSAATALAMFMMMFMLLMIVMMLMFLMVVVMLMFMVLMVMSTATAFAMFMMMLMLLMVMMVMFFHLGFEVLKLCVNSRSLFHCLKYQLTIKLIPICCNDFCGFVVIADKFNTSVELFLSETCCMT